MMSSQRLDVAIILSKTDLSDFSSFTQKITQYTGQPNTCFLFSDEYPIIARYLNNLQYRKCIVYHPGPSPKHRVGSYANKSGFLSYPEIHASLRDEADVVIDSKSV